MTINRRLQHPTPTPDARRVTASLGGLVFVDKPAGLTSHDVVARVRRAARTKRVGHAGTLDPFATGLLVLAVGTATRLLQFIHGEPKVYVSEIEFGAETDTDDATGSVVRNAPLPAPARIDEALRSLTGRIAQVPPAFSAKHVDGRRAYDLARRGKDVDLPAVQVAVHSWEILKQSASSITARVTCGGGTYIRALARDLGRRSDSAAFCRALRRESSGPAHVDDAVALEQLAPGSIEDGIVPLVNPLLVLGDMRRIVVDATQQRALAQGRVIAAPELRAEQVDEGKMHVAFIDVDDNVLGIGEGIVDARGASAWQPRVVLDPASLSTVD